MSQTLLGKKMLGIPWIIHMGRMGAKFGKIFPFLRPNALFDQLLPEKPRQNSVLKKGSVLEARLPVYTNLAGETPGRRGESAKKGFKLAGYDTRP